MSDPDKPSYSGPGFGLYVHWPFCEKKCPYCDFNSHVADAIDHDRWRAAYDLEISWAADLLSDEQNKRPVITSIFFGGGTPSLMDPKTVSAILETVHRLFCVAAAVEITLEANPSSVEAGQFSAFKSAGVNRVSVGIQSFNDDELSFLGRRHNSAEARKALETACRTFDRVSCDFIYALPEQSLRAWVETLKQGLLFQTEHLSAYQLTIEQGTPFFRDKIAEPPPAVAEAMFKETNAILETAGLPAYEVSNHARAGSECRHNLLYWRSGAHLGIGPGAHGRLQDGGGEWSSHYRIHNPRRWLGQVFKQGHGTAKEVLIPTDERVEEVVMMGLRLRAGLYEQDLVAATGKTFIDALNIDNLSLLQSRGFLDMKDNGAVLRATDKGRLRLNAVLEKLLT